MSGPTLESEQESVVRQRQIIERFRIGNERVGAAAQIEQPAPVGQAPRKARHLVADDDADAPEPDLGNQLHEPFARTALPRLPQVSVVDLDTNRRPTQENRALAQTVLKRRRFSVALNLPAASTGERRQPPSVPDEMRKRVSPDGSAVAGLSLSTSGDGAVAARRRHNLMRSRRRHRQLCPDFARVSGSSRCSYQRTSPCSASRLRIGCIVRSINSLWVD